MDVVTSVASLIQLVLAAAPKVIEAAAATKAYITGLFIAGVVDKETQDKLHAHVDEVAVALLTGKIPPQFTVEPDPVA